MDWIYVCFGFYITGVFAVLVDAAPLARRERGEGSEFAQRLSRLLHGTWTRSILTAFFWPLVFLFCLLMLFGCNNWLEGER